MAGKMKKDYRRSGSMNTIIQDMELEVLKQNISNKHKQMVREIDEKLEKIFDDFLSDLNRFEVEKLFSDEYKNTHKIDERSTSENPEKLTPRLKLPEKHFQPRNALLTDLFEIKHLKTIYHIFIVIFNLLFLNVFISDFAMDGSINIGLSPIITGNLIF